MSDENQQQDMLARTQPWLRRLPSTQELKQLKFEAQWDPQAKAVLDGHVAHLQALVVAAKGDQHDVFFPTHIAECGGEIQGYASIGPVPMVNIWLDSEKQKRHPRDAVTLLNMVENEASRMGYKQIVLPCGNNSPFRPLLGSKFGYRFLMESGFFTKDLR